MLRPRRRPRYGPQLCAVAAALLLLLSVSLLYIRLASDNGQKHTLGSDASAAFGFEDPFTDDDPLLRDSDTDLTRAKSIDDRIDEFDIVEDESSRGSNEGEILRESEEEVEGDQFRDSSSSSSNSGYYFDHATGVIRRAFDKRSIDQLDGWDDDSSSFIGGFTASREDASKDAFGSDDIPVDEEARKKIVKVKGIEDALLLKLGSRVSPLREGWGPWFDAKSVFLRKDRMFRSSLEAVNPLTNPLLQDPDGAGVTGFTRGDKVVLEGLLHEFKKVPFLGKKPLGYTKLKSGKDAALKELSEKHNVGDQVRLGKDSYIVEKKDENTGNQQKAKIKRSERRILDEVSINDSSNMKFQEVYDASHNLEKEGMNNRYPRHAGEIVEPFHNRLSHARTLKDANTNARSGYSLLDPMYPDGKRWGYFPGIHPHLSFSNFMDSFFRRGHCLMRVFMVWNSPPWMYGVRHQRGLESVLFHHPDACVVVFSETIELDFFKQFVKDGFKVAVAMPNLEELLKDTPTSVFASVWHEWRVTKFYSTHYSELVRLAALYKYGGIYLDADVIVLRPVSSLRNTVGLEDFASNSPLNGAIMAFTKNSSFIEECLFEFYASYDDTLLRWNGADLLTRVAGNFSAREIASRERLELNIQHQFTFFPISSRHITRYFRSPETIHEKAYQNALLRKILNKSHTFHMWNSLTSALIPEADSLVARIVNHRCIRCLDVL